MVYNRPTNEALHDVGDVSVIESFMIYDLTKPFRVASVLRPLSERHWLYDFLTVFEEPVSVNLHEVVFHRANVATSFDESNVPAYEPSGRSRNVFASIFSLNVTV